MKDIFSALNFRLPLLCEMLPHASAPTPNMKASFSLALYAILGGRLQDNYPSEQSGG